MKRLRICTIALCIALWSVYTPSLFAAEHAIAGVVAALTEMTASVTVGAVRSDAVADAQTLGVGEISHNGMPSGLAPVIRPLLQGVLVETAAQEANLTATTRQDADLQVVVHSVGEQEVVWIVQLVRSNGELVATEQRTLSLDHSTRTALMEGQTGARVTAATERDVPNSRYNALTIPLDTVVSDVAIEHAGDEDWFRLDLSGATPTRNDDDGTYFHMLDIFTTGSVDTMIAVFQEGQYDVALMENDDRDGRNAGVHISTEGIDELFVQVKAFTTSTGPYELHVESFFARGDEWEPNGTQAGATVFTREAGEIEATFSPSGDIDYYRFPSPPNEDSVLNVQTRGDIDTRIFVYNEEGVEVMADDDSGDLTNALVSIGGEEGTVTVRVQPYHSSDDGSYRLVWNILEPTPDAYEEDDSLEESFPLESLEVYQERTFTTENDSDWIRFTVGEQEAARTTIIETFGEVDTYITVYNDVEEIIAQSDDEGENSNARIIAELPVGVYYAEIRPFYTTGVNSPYQLEVRQR